MNLNFDIDFFDHPKTKRLARLLGKGSEVLPLKLWVYGARYFPKDGRLTEISAQEIEDEIRWWGEKLRCVKALVDTRWLDLDGETYVIHDWKEYQGHIWAMSEKGKANALKRWGKIADDASSNAGSNAGSNAAGNAPTSLLPLNPPKAPQGGADASRRSKGRRTADERRGEVAREKARVAVAQQEAQRKADESETAAKLAAEIARIRAKVEADGEQSLERWDRVVWLKHREEELCKVAKSA